MLPDLAFFPPIIAHRGASGAAPENTIEAIHAAKKEGATWVEFDVKITADGVPVLLHDETLDRTTEKSGAVAETAWDALKGKGIPHLADALTAVLANDLSVIIEIKPCPGRVRATTMVAMIEISKVWPEKGNVPVIASFDLECLEIAAQLEPPWPRCLLLESWDDDWSLKAGQVAASAVGLPAAQLTQERVKSFLDKGIALLGYALKDSAQAKEMLAWGVSAVYSGNPRAILNVL